MQMTQFNSPLLCAPELIRGHLVKNWILKPHIQPTATCPTRICFIPNPPQPIRYKNTFPPIQTHLMKQPAPLAGLDGRTVPTTSILS
jgi:hypothetical protein